MSEEEKKTHVDEEGREWKQRYCDYNKAFFWVCQEGDGEIPDKAAGLDGIFPPPPSELALLVAGPPVNKGSDERVYCDAAAVQASACARSLTLTHACTCRPCCLAESIPTAETTRPGTMNLDSQKKTDSADCTPAHIGTAQCMQYHVCSQACMCGPGRTFTTGF